MTFAFRFDEYGLSSDGLTAFAPFFRFMLICSAISQAVMFQRNSPRPSTIHASCRSVNGSGFTPRIPAYR